MKDTAEDAQVETKSGLIDAEQLRLYGIIAGVVVLAIAILAWLLLGRGTVSTDNAYVKASKIQITAEVSGLITEVAVGENQYVKKGDLLFRIDPEPYRIAVERLNARRAEIKSQIEMKKARYAEKAIELDRAHSRFEYAQRELDRQTKLAERKVVSEAKLDEARQNRDFEEQTVSTIRQEMVALAADLAGNPEIAVSEHPSYLAVSAELKQAQLDLEKTQIRAPTNGVVSQVSNIRPGVYADRGRPLFAVVDTNNMWIEANLKETQLENVRIGQPVEVEVAAYPGYEWRGRVTSFSVATGAEFAIIPPQNATGKWVHVTQRVPVRITLEHMENEPQLVAGMSADVSINTGKRKTPPPIEEARPRVFGRTTAR